MTDPTGAVRWGGFGLDDIGKNPDSSHGRILSIILRLVEKAKNRKK